MGFEKVAFKMPVCKEKKKKSQTDSYGEFPHPQTVCLACDSSSLIYN